MEEFDNQPIWDKVFKLDFKDVSCVFLKRFNDEFPKINFLMAHQFLQSKGYQLPVYFAPNGEDEKKGESHEK